MLSNDLSALRECHGLPSNLPLRRTERVPLQSTERALQTSVLKGAGRAQKNSQRMALRECQN